MGGGAGKGPPTRGVVRRCATRPGSGRPSPLTDGVAMSTLAAEALAGLVPGSGLRQVTTAGRMPRLDRYRFLLLLRFGLINLTGFALLGAA